MAVQSRPSDDTMSQPLVIIGNGMAAARLVQELAKRSLGRYAIAVVGEEPRLAYNRVLLSSVLAGEVQTSEIELKPACWWRDHGVTLRYGCAAIAVDPAARAVMLADGQRLVYEKLVFATGSQPLKLPMPGMELDGVFTFRDVGDVETITIAANADRRVVVIGGGLLGLEAAYGLAKAGAKVTLVHLMDRLMERQLDVRAAAMLKHAVEAKGIRVLLEAETAGIAGIDHVEAVELKDGRAVAADAVVVAVGIRPNAALARAAGIKVGRGIIVDDCLETSVPGVHAIGECAEHHGLCYGLVEPAYEQARVLAEHLSGKSTAYGGSVQATNLKVSGVNVFSAGDFLGAPGTEQIVLTDPGLGTYKKLVIDHDRLAGTVLFGDTADGLWYLDLIRSGAVIEAFRNDLVFGRAFAERQAA
jgi:nitrite reductase (NADH) large subunit